MGIYLYTFRAKTTQFVINGQITPVHGFEYGMKYGYGYGYNDRREQFVETNLVNKADAAFAGRKSNFVVMSTKGKIEDGDDVYGDVATSTWVDTGSLKATIVGYAKKVGKVWTVVATSDWVFNRSVMDKASGLFVDVATRQHAEGGNVRHEQVWANHEMRTFCTYEEAVAVARAKVAQKATDEAAAAARRAAARAMADAAQAEQDALKVEAAAQKALQDAAALRAKAEAARQALRN